MSDRNKRKIAFNIFLFCLFYPYFTFCIIIYASLFRNEHMPVQKNSQCLVSINLKQVREENNFKNYLYSIPNFVSNKEHTNRIRIFLLFVVLVGVASTCQSKGGQATGQEQDAIDGSLAVTPTEDEKTIFGVVEDAPMNNFVLATPKGDAMFASIMGQEPSEVGDLELGGTTQVNYIEKGEEPGSNTISTTKKMIVVRKKTNRAND